MTSQSVLKRRDIFNFLHEKGFLSDAVSSTTQDAVWNYIYKFKYISSLEDETVCFLKLKVKQFCTNLQAKWKKHHRILDKFLLKHTDWLDELIFNEKSSGKRGRPKSGFLEASQKTKRRIVENMLMEHTPEELEFAARLAHRKQGKRNLAKAIQQVANKSPRSLKKTIKPSDSTVTPYTPREALGLIISLDLTKYQYECLKKGAKERNVYLYPSYHQVLLEKRMCYPEESSIIVSETEAKINLQALLDHSTKRLILSVEQTLNSMISTYDLFNNYQYTVVYKWGMDGSSGHSLYKQKFSEGEGEESDSSIILTSLVPLQLKAQHRQSSQEVVVWKNPCTSSTRFCRPIRFQFLKEDDEKTKEEVASVESEISRVRPTDVNFDTNKTISVHHSLLKTMIDGKVCNSLMNNNSSQTCYICKATPSQMNNIENALQRTCNSQALEFGLSTLHANIRFFECLLHLSYRLDIQKWRVQTKEDKEKVKARKTRIISLFRKETGLLVDVVKQGVGTTNDGNTARRFFADPEKSSKITGIDEKLITRFAVILQTISCGEKINTQAFRDYAINTAKYFVSLYSWYYMPASVHKILIHGADVIETFILPIGNMSEDAQEARHKDLRNFRLWHTRKLSRVASNEDLLKRLLESSDPLISSTRPFYPKKSRDLHPEAVGLLDSQ